MSQGNALGKSSRGKKEGYREADRGGDTDYQQLADVHARRQTRARQMRLALRKVEALPDAQSQALLPLVDSELPAGDDLAP